MTTYDFDSTMTNKYHLTSHARITSDNCLTKEMRDFMVMKLISLPCL